jgi:hypothetical protein
MIRGTAGTLLIVLFVSSAAVGQEADETAQRPRVPHGATIFVLDKQGVEHRGRFVRFDGQELVMSVGEDERGYKRDVIARIERSGDSLKNGAIAGAIVGGLMGLLAASLQAEDLGQWIKGVAISTGFYTAIGTGVDAAVQGRTRVYQSWPAAPVRQQPRAALAFSVRW